MSEKQFDEHHILHELKHYLPSQTPLKDFIHHNSLHAFQHMKFYNAIFKASKIFGYQATLQLDEFRTLYETGRINDAVLDKIITERKGKNQLSEWKQNVLFKKYDEFIPFFLEFWEVIWIREFPSGNSHIVNKDFLPLSEPWKRIALPVFLRPDVQRNYCMKTSLLLIY